MPILDSAFVGNVAKAAPVGAAGGVLYELLRRKMRNQEEELAAPEEKTMLPMVERSPVQIKKRASLSIGHAVGALGGATAGMNIVGKLMNRKEMNQLDATLAKKEKEFDDILMAEQSAASGVPMKTLSVLKSADAHRRLDGLVTKIAENLYDCIEKQGDVALKSLFSDASKLLKLEDRPALQAIAIGSGLGGVGWGYHATASKDPNQVVSSTIRKALRERLTGRDNNVGPMPIRVESESPEMRPLKPGATSLVDPTRGRDVLEGI